MSATAKQQTGPATTANDQPRDSDGNQPVAKFSNGTLHAAVFRDTIVTNDQPRVTLSIAFSKRYFDKQRNTWETSRSLFPAELPNAIRVLTRALAYCEEQQQSDDHPF